MKKKLLAILALVVSVATLFTACGGGIEAAVYTVPEANTAYTTNGSKKLDDVKDFTNVIEVNDTYVLFEDEDVKADNKLVEEEYGTGDPKPKRADYVYSETVTTYKLYNVVTGEFKGEIPGAKIYRKTNYRYDAENATANYDEIEYTVERKETKVVGGENYVVVATRSYENIDADTTNLQSNGATLSIYDINMNNIVSKSYKKSIATSDFDWDNGKLSYKVDFDGDNNLEGFVVDEVLYKASGDTFVKSDVEIDNIAVNLKGEAEVVGNYLHFVKKEIAGQQENPPYAYIYKETKIVTYNYEDFSLVNSYRIPSYYTNVEKIYFDNGNYLIQAIVNENDFADAYDYLDDAGKKYSLETKLVDIESGEVTDIECAYLLEDGMPKSYLEENDVVMEDYDALAYASSKIDAENKRLTDIETVALGLNSDGEIIEIETSIAYQNCERVVTKLANGNWIIVDVEGMAHLYNEDGDLVKSIKAGYLANDKYYRVGDKVYDINFNKIFTPDTDVKETEVTVFADGIIVKTVEEGKGENITTWTRYTENSETVIASKSTKDAPLTKDGTYYDVKVYANYYVVTTYKTSTVDGVKKYDVNVAAYNGQGNELAEVDYSDVIVAYDMEWDDYLQQDVPVNPHIGVEVDSTAVGDAAILQIKAIVDASTEKEPNKTEAKATFCRISK